jgi:hypothetical protein
VCLPRNVVFFHSYFASVNKQGDYGEAGLIFSYTSTMPRSFKVRYIPCPEKTCTRQFTNQSGLKNHIRTHRTPKANPNRPAPQPPINDNNNDILVDDDVLVDPEHLNPPPNPENDPREKVTYHPLINGKPPLFYS